MDIKRAIEVQRRRLNRMAEQTENLTALLDEAQKMDRLLDIYETRRTTECIRKDA